MSFAVEERLSDFLRRRFSFAVNWSFTPPPAYRARRMRSRCAPARLPLPPPAFRHPSNPLRAHWT